MRKGMLKVLFGAFVVLFVFTAAGCNFTVKRVPSEKNLEETLDEKLYNISHPKDSSIELSSNPYDYIKNGEGKEDYNFIVSQREKSLDYMLRKFAASNNNGLQEYIMAIACSEILKEDPNAKKWASGREWYDNYIKNHKGN